VIQREKTNYLFDSRIARAKDEACLEGDTRTYVTQFEHIKQILAESEGNPDIQHVIDTLGHGIKAVEAVPAAIFAFLCKSNTCLKDVLFYAMSLGGDTDTIGSMAGAIAGAYWGDEHIPEEWYLVTEGVKEITEYADKLYTLRVEVTCTKN
jgi:poly(ADP-ribose) glycohydrolase ARH3